MEILFEKYQNMIRYCARRVSLEKDFDYEELLSQGYLIFVEAVDKFDANKASFSTFLFNQLRSLEYYSLKNNFSSSKKVSAVPMHSLQMPNGDFYSKFEKYFASFEFEKFCDVLLCMETAQQELSEKALIIFNWVLSNEWRKPGDWHLPGLKTAKREFGSWGNSEVEKAWVEIKNWWSVNFTNE